MGVKIIDLTAGGGTSNIPAFNPYEYLLLLSSATFSSGWTIQSSGTPQDGMKVRIVYRGVANFDGNNLTVYGKVVPAHLQAKPWEAVATYENSVWNVVITADTTVAETMDAAVVLKDVSIPTAKYIDGSVTFEKFESLVEGEVIIGNSSNIASALFAGGDAKLLIGNGTTMTSVAMSGHINMTNAGVTEIQPAVITESMLAFELGNIQVASITLNQSNVNTLFTVPIEILADALIGADNAAMIYGVALDYNFDVAAFVFAADMQIQHNTGAILVPILQADVNSGADKTWNVPATKVDMVKNSGFRVQAATSDPGGGGPLSTFKIHIYYSVVNFS